MKDAPLDFGKIIRQRRDAKGWTQMAIAAQLEMSDANYGKIERGEQSPTLDQMARIAEALETDLGELLGFGSQYNTHNPAQSGIGNHSVVNNHFNEQQAQQTERLLALIQAQTDLLARVAATLEKNTQ